MWVLGPGVTFPEPSGGPRPAAWQTGSSTLSKGLSNSLIQPIFTDCLLSKKCTSFKESQKTSKKKKNDP